MIKYSKFHCSAYPWLLNYINRHSKRQTRQISVHTFVSQAESGRTLTDFTFLPGHGTHFFVYNYRWIQVERQREKQVIQKGDYRTPLETVTLTTIGTVVIFGSFFQFIDNQRLIAAGIACIWDGSTLGV
ncbi:unnamed protein product, partial [Gongylonema pulchrum]|uniref:BCS1_N domain-containing protein n=1 Tax=Gongylonema pulchrum TaxID=637853 RepID=A0A183DJC2_9BILA